MKIDLNLFCLFDPLIALNHLFNLIQKDQSYKYQNEAYFGEKKRIHAQNFRLLKY